MYDSPRGWMRLHRGIESHWIWEDPVKLKWWLGLLLMANWEEKKVLVGSTIVVIKRGQLLASNKYLMDKWGVCTHTVRNFLRLLEMDDMITQTAYPKYNIITICNYDKYQPIDDLNADPNTDHYNDPNSDHSADPSADPNKEYNKQRSKEVEKRDTDVSQKKFSFKNELIALGVDEQVANDWIMVRKNKKLSQTQTAFNHTKKNIETISSTHNLSANEIIRTAVERSWGGVEPDFFKNIPAKGQQDLFSPTQNESYSPAGIKYQ